VICNVFTDLVKQSGIKFRVLARLRQTTKISIYYCAEIESKFRNANAIALLLSPSGIIRGPNWQDYSRRRLGHVLEIAGITRL